jgi:hypothetical protein
VPHSARADGDWWVLLVTDGLTVEFAPELYRAHDDAEREAERLARVLSARSQASVERPFQDRWVVGDEWIRLVSSFLPEEGTEIWIGTYWTRDGSPEPEAELFANGDEAVGWVREPTAGAKLVESHDTRGRLGPGIASAAVKKRPKSTAPSSCCDWPRAAFEAIMP